ncbi:hypothetical protein CBER1_05970 [Cercospora berteroae]|uniref:protein-ribulosamine 3-kinase n=1 Tax=Cercospora berteroae TaxID=357750 RepID=A0A2S6CAQ4_9PEZI|nr:hypothetical protein CBER1_05970 [Cercospora berteroae]
MDAFSSRAKDVVAEIGSSVELDANVRRALPPGSHVLNAFTYGTAAWTKATRVIVALEDGTEKSFFLKVNFAIRTDRPGADCTAQVAPEETGRQMIEGEFASISEIAKYSPSLTPTPLAKGAYEDGSIPTYFFLMEFLDIDTGAPEPAPFCQQLAGLHSRSVSPTGQFGFPMITCHGPHPQNTTWDDSWSKFFARMIRQFFDREISTNGASKDGAYETEFDKMVTETIPKVLEPLQSTGRTLKPCLVHGDLWDENCGTSLQTGQSKIFDAAVFYGHNEYDLGMWRATPAVRFGRPHIRQYLRHFPPSEPKEQWDDRNRLYGIKFDIAHSIGWPDSCERQREIIFGNMRYLNKRYSPQDTSGGAEQ